jgi:lipoate-protein ligase B
MRSCHVICLGLTPYEEALTLQRRLAGLRADGRVNDLLILLQHPPVITLGRGGRKRHLLIPESSLGALGIGFFEVERGGDMTYHGPGQLVGYPILNLVEHGRDVHRYLRCLERVLTETLWGFGIPAGTWTGRTGAWVAERKIASIGIHLSRWVTRHGFALNVDMDLVPFELIVPCGIRGARATTMTNELSFPISVDRVIPRLVHHFEAEFNLRLVPTTLAHLFGSVEAWREEMRSSDRFREAAACTSFP